MNLTAAGEIKDIQSGIFDLRDSFPQMKIAKYLVR
jgi:hypothetical protein